MARPKKYPDRPDGCINMAEASRILGVSRATLYRYREAPDFPPVIEQGGQAWFDEAAVRQWAERRSGKPLEAPWITADPSSN